MAQTADQFEGLQLALDVLVLGGAEDDFDGGLNAARCLGAPDLAEAAAADHLEQPVAELRRQDLATPRKSTTGWGGLSALRPPGRGHWLLHGRRRRRKSPLLLHLPVDQG